MSINVSVSGNPIILRRGKMILSDIENIRKSDREHRVRLRKEQVREQSKLISKTVREKTKQRTEEELKRLQNANTEMKKARDRRLMEAHQRYQDTENIGYAHDNAVNQPDVEFIKAAEEQRNRALAKARGTDAMQMLHEVNKVPSPRSKKYERLQKVRGVENERSHMIAQLPKKSCAGNIGLVESSESSNIIKAATASPSKRKAKSVCKNSPVKEQKKQSKVHSHSVETPCTSMQMPDQDNTRTSTTNSCTDITKKSKSNKLSYISKTVSDIPQEVSKNKVCESDENEPRKTVPVISSIYGKPERDNYQNSSSSISSTSSSSSISDDSSYASEINTKTTTARKTPRHHTSPVSSKISLYDHKTRQRSAYDVPSAFVERMNIKNKPNAEDLAQEIMQLESQEAPVLAKDKETAKQRSKDAMYREKCNKDYNALLKTMYDLSKKAARFEAQQISSSIHPQIHPPSKKSEDNMRRKKNMDRAMQTILRSEDLAPLDSRIERPITITPRDYIHSKESTTAWTHPPHSSREETEESCEDDDSFIRKSNVLENLLKLEKMKRLLLKNLGTDLPDNIFNCVMKSVVNPMSALSSQESVNNNVPKPTPSEIQVINMSSCENTKPVRKVSTQTKFTDTNLKTCNPVSARRPQKSSTESSVSTRDQQVQVELKQDKPKEEAKRYPIEPVIKIVTPGHVDNSVSSSSNSSASTDVMIEIGGKEIRMESKESNVKISKDQCSDSTASNSEQNGSAKTPLKITFDKKKDGTGFEVGGFIYDSDKKHIIMWPKKKKAGNKTSESERQQTVEVRTKKGTSTGTKNTHQTIARKSSATVSGKSRSLPESRIGSPNKKISKSAPSSRHASPKKPPPVRHTKPCERKKPESIVQRRTQCTQVSINSSSDSSQMNQSAENATGKLLHRLQQVIASRQLSSNGQDVSDTSTTYASPPAAVAGTFLNAVTTSAAILELLDPKIRQSIKLRASQVSPVSSPETPSPRTMMLPSNIPKPGRVSRNLKFSSLIGTQIRTESSSIPRNGESPRERLSVQTRPQAPTQTQPQGETQPQVQTQVCTCSNPTCKLFHDVLENPHFSSALKDFPDVMNFDELTHTSRERIASLTDLLDKVRKEKKDIDLSIIANEVSNMANQSVQPRLSQSRNRPTLSKPEEHRDMEKMVKDVEAIQVQLRQILRDSQKIISSQDLPKPIVPYSSIEKSPTFNFSRDSTMSDTTDDIDSRTAMPASAPTSTPATKPKIVRDEKVNIRLDRYRPKQSTGVALQCDEASKTAASSSVPDQSEDIVKMLSKEIREQSKSINKSIAIDGLKDTDDSFLKSSRVVKDSGESSPANEENKESASQVQTGSSDFVPLLAGIPKIKRSLSNSSSNGRARPPVTLINAPLRSKIDSPAHELSTIDEFNTPDTTTNKSLLSTKSPSNKYVKNLSVKDVQLSVSSPRKETGLPKSKPSVHVAPLPAHRPSQQLSQNLSNKSTTRSADRSPKKRESKKSEFSDSLCTLPDMHIEQLQQSQDNTDGNYACGISQISEFHTLPDGNIEQLLISEFCEETKFKSVTPVQRPPSFDENQDKCLVTSTSSTSISRMSGVSEITTTPSSDLNLCKCPSSPEEMDQTLKKHRINWAMTTLKKTREASALGSSSSSDVTPVNVVEKLVSPTKKHQNSTSHNLPDISDVSSISIKYANMSTEQSVLVKRKLTSTPNKLSNSNSDRTESTLGSFCSELNIVVQNESADITVNNVSFSNNNLA